MVHRHVVSDEDATVVRRLKEGGAVLLGKPQLTEGAYSDHHPSITPPRNPWNADYWPGISSSGSGAATAAGLCYGSLASDTGGSIRWPAAANGVTGLKPTWGRVSRFGVFELAASLDHVGTMARSAVDAGILLGAIAGSDPKDPTALPDPVPNYLAAIKGHLGGLRIGIDAAWNGDDVDAGTQAVLAEAIGGFSELGAEIVEIQFPDVAQAVADWVPNCAVEAAVAHKATYPAHKDRYGSILASVIEAGHAISGMGYQEILLRRMAFRGRVEHLFGKIDLLLTPVQPFAPLTLAKVQTLGEQPGLIAMLQRYTCPFDMSGHPALTLPGGFTQGGMPIGFQLVAGHLDEAVLVRAGAAFQGISAWHRRHGGLCAAVLQSLFGDQPVRYALGGGAGALPVQRAAGGVDSRRLCLQHACGGMASTPHRAQTVSSMAGSSLAAAFAITFVGFGSAYTFSAFVPSLQQDFGASRGAVSLASSP